MTKLIAIHKLTVSIPSAGLKHTGLFDDLGEPILRKQSRQVMPGETYEESDPAEVRLLINAGAAKLADGVGLPA